MLEINYTERKGKIETVYIQVKSFSFEYLLILLKTLHYNKPPFRNYSSYSEKVQPRNIHFGVLTNFLFVLNE